MNQDNTKDHSRIKRLRNVSVFFIFAITFFFLIDIVTNRFGNENTSVIRILPMFLLGMVCNEMNLRKLETRSLEDKIESLEKKINTSNG